MKKRKNILLLTVMLAAGFVLAACSNTSPAGKTSTEDVPTSMEETLSAEEVSDNKNEEPSRESEGTETKAAELETSEPEAAEPETEESENGASETLESGMMETSKDGNILIAYYSHTGNTEEAAQKIAELTGGELAEIKRAEEYEDLYEEAEAEILDGVHPEITVSRDNIEAYDTIFVGYPIWWDEAPAMIAAFLSEHDFSGKTIVPFCTSASDDIGNSLHIFNELCPDAKIAEGLTANDLDEIEPWLSGLGLLKE